MNEFDIKAYGSIDPWLRAVGGDCSHITHFRTTDLGCVNRLEFYSSARKKTSPVQKFLLVDQIEEWLDDNVVYPPPPQHYGRIAKGWRLTNLDCMDGKEFIVEPRWIRFPA